MKIAVIGALGQLGNDLVEHLTAAGTNEVLGLGGPADSCEEDKRCDITDRKGLLETLEPFRPEVIYNCAAFHRVDECEEKVEEAFRVNVAGVSNLAEAARSLNAVLVHFSTDYVFDGELDRPYTEEDEPRPLNVYGQAKLDGENRVLAACERAVILRVSWVFSSTGNNFVKTMLRLAADRDQLGVVSDQHGAPCSADSIARASFEILAADAIPSRTYHLQALPETT